MDTKYTEGEKTMIVHAYAKINLGLKVLGRRPDGYHGVDMIMQSISLADTITLEPAASFAVTTDLAELPCDKRNLMVKAALAFQKATGCDLNVHLHGEKQIFVAAGLAGGSTDAAAVLKLLNQYYGEPLPRQQLETVAATIGSDVPFCIAGGTQRARGRGELMTVLPAVPDFHLVLVKPAALEVSTAWAYGEIDRKPPKNSPDIDKLEQAIVSQKLPDVLALMGNDLELVTVPAHPILQGLLTELQELGAAKAMMSGSGPTVFGIFFQAEAAAKAAGLLKQKYRELQIETAHTVREGY